MSEGELKKRLEKLLSPEILRWNPEVLGLVDESRKDIFNSIPIEEIKGLTKDNPELIAKLLKWLGELEVGSLGSKETQNNDFNKDKHKGGE